MQASVSVSGLLIRLIAITVFSLSTLLPSSRLLLLLSRPSAALLFGSCEVAAFVSPLRNKATAVPRHYIIKRIFSEKQMKDCYMCIYIYIDFRDVIIFPRDIKSNVLFFGG